jgi:membrane protein YqaA with SNARE-associated domain
MKKLLLRFRGWVEASVDQPWFVWTIATFAFLDLFVIFFPVDWILITTAVLRKRKGYELALACAVGSAMGALALGVLSHLYGLSVIEYFSKGITHTRRWHTTEREIQDFGAWALAAISVGPLPQVPAVVLCGLAKMRGYKIFASVLSARLIKYLFLAWASNNAPGFLKKISFKKQT